MGKPSVIIANDVASELAFAARYRPDSYQACVLLGTPADDGLAVRGFIDLAATDGPFLFLRTLAEDWAPMQRRARRAGADLEPVGWASFRDGAADALTPAEQLVHRTFFNRPHQITLLIDPTNERMRAFGADASGELVPVSLSGPPPEPRTE